MPLKRKSIITSILGFLAALGLWFGRPPVTNPPTPTETPSPTPVPSPSPAPLPTPPLAYLCKLPPQTEPSKCVENPIDDVDRPFFMEALMSAQDSAEENGFIKNGLVVDEVAYMNEVVRILRVSGYCAINGREGGHTSDDEVWIKNENSFSEHYDILTAAGAPWTKYAAICRHAKF